MLDSGVQDGWTPLLIACFDGGVGEVAGSWCNIDAPNKNVSTPYFMASNIIPSSKAGLMWGVIN